MIVKFFQSAFAQQKLQKLSELQSSPPRTDAYSLPNDLASTILDTEIECQGQNVSKELINSLIILYTSAIETYQSLGSPKYQIYKRRMLNFLSKPTVQKILEGRNCTLLRKKQEAELIKLQANICTKEQANKIIETYQKNADQAKKKIERIIKNQDQNLENRIQRRKSMSNKSQKSERDDFEEAELEIIPKRVQKMKNNSVLLNIKNRNIKRVFI